MVVVVSSLVHLYRKARNSKGRFPLKLTPQELDRSTGTLGQDARIERNGQLGEDQEGPARRKGRRRVMALSYHEQLNSALKYEIFSLATLAADLGASIVEPIVVNSRMYGCPELVPDLDQPHVHSALPLSTMVDMRTPLRNCAGVDMEPLKAFVRDLPSKVVLVYAQNKKRKLKEINIPQGFQNELTAVMQSRNNTGVLQCTDLFLRESRDIMTMVENGLSHHMSHPQ